MKSPQTTYTRLRRSAGMTEHGMSTPSTVEVRPLADLSHTILLAGAGKMGGAVLQGWLALGLSPEKVAVIEPQPSPELAGLSKQGLRLNPTRDVPGPLPAA